MSSPQALLMEIHYPDGSESLYLMTGQGFELLREDKGGREVYGVRHRDREYLFFPFSFKPVDAGVLSLHMPPEYEEHCLGHKADGARIVFGSLHGVPFFPEMPDEYKSNSGRIAVDGSGRVRVLLDKLEEGLSPFAGHSCGCEQDHHGTHAHQTPTEGDGHGCGHGRHDLGTHAHPASASGGGCGCGQEEHSRHGQRPRHDESAGRRAGDEQIAAAIRHTAEAFNAALRKGAEAGLSIQIHASPQDGDCPQVCVRQIARPL